MTNEAIYSSTHSSKSTVVSHLALVRPAESESCARANRRIMFGAPIAIDDDDDEYMDPRASVPLDENPIVSASNRGVGVGGGGGEGGTISALFVTPTTLTPNTLPEQATVTKEGFLHKIGGSWKSWKTRYFRLVPGRLLYYRDGVSTDPLGSILLPGASLAVFSADVHAGHAFCFGLTPQDSDRQYVLDCDSVVHRSEWLSALAAPTRQRLRLSPDSVREGYLTKLGERVKNWKRRYFVLTRTALSYHPSFGELGVVFGSIPLSEGFVVESDELGDELPDAESTTAADTASSPASASPPSSPARSSPSAALSPASPASSPSFVSRHPYHFSVRAQGAQRFYVFCTPTRAERDAWVQVLREIQQNGRI